MQQPVVTGTTCRNCGQPHSGAGRFCRWCGQLMIGPMGMKAASIGQRFVALVLDVILFFLTLVIGYIIWALIVYAQGQTPGKQLIGIRSVRTDGTEAGWGLTFAREFLVKGILIGFISSATGGIVGLLNILWPLWDRDRQAFHDKIVGTVVVQGTRNAF